MYRRVLTVLGLLTASLAAQAQVPASEQLPDLVGPQDPSQYVLRENNLRRAINGNFLLRDAGDAIMPQTRANLLMSDTVAVAVYMPESMKGVCDGVTDIGAAANLAIAYAKDNLNDTRAVGGSAPAARIVFPNGFCYVSTPIDYTGITGAQKITLDLTGTTLLGNTTGMPVIDGTETEQPSIFGGRITGDAVNIPVTGIRLGRGSPAPGGSGSNGSVRDMFISGSFSVAGCYQNQSEQTIFVNVICNSNYPTAAQLLANPSATNAHGLLVDGYSKYWSAVPTLFPGATSPGIGSFVGATFITSSGTATGTATGGDPTCGIWIGNTRGMRMIGSYATTGSVVGGPPICLYDSTGGVNWDLKLDVHKEIKAGMWPGLAFYGDGTENTPTYRGMEVSDESCCGTHATSFFGLLSGSAITKVTLNNATIKVANPNSFTTFFDDPTKFLVTASMVSLGSGATFNLPFKPPTSGDGFVGGCVGDGTNMQCVSQGFYMPGSGTFFSAGGSTQVHTGDMIVGNQNDATRHGGTLKNASTANGGSVEFNLDNSVSKAVSFLLNGTGTVAGNGVGSFTIDSVSGTYLSGNGTNALQVTSTGKIFLPNQDTTGGGKQPLCFDTVTKQVLIGSAGAC